VLGGGCDEGGSSGCEERVFTMSDIRMNENRLKNRSHRRHQTVYAQFLIGDVARLLTFWADYSESECLHKEEDNRVEEKLGVSRRGHSDA
jgi:hypothetical protein